MYAMFGDAQHPPHVPAAWMSQYAEAIDKAPNPALFRVDSLADVEYTSYFALGPDPSEPFENFPNIGLTPNFPNWDSSTDLSIGIAPGPTNDCSVFWMSPPDAGRYGGRPMIAQLTISSQEAWFVTFGFQGKYKDPQCSDWNVPGGITWIHRSSDDACPAGLEGTDCSLDVDECASNPCEDGLECWQGVNEYACRHGVDEWRINENAIQQLTPELDDDHIEPGGVGMPQGVLDLLSHGESFVTMVEITGGQCMQSEGIASSEIDEGRSALSLPDL